MDNNNNNERIITEWKKLEINCLLFKLHVIATFVGRFLSFSDQYLFTALDSEN